jgi:hypothetical protein
MTGERTCSAGLVRGSSPATRALPGLFPPIESDRGNAAWTLLCGAWNKRPSEGADLGMEWRWPGPRGC